MHLTLRKSRLEDFNLFVEQCKLIISSDQLSTKDISLVNNILIVFLELIVFLVGFSDDVSQLLDLVIELNFVFLVLLVQVLLVFEL